jgi:hypothetical protein
MWKEFQLTFSRPLTDKEERILIAYFKTMTEKMREILKVGKGAYDNPILKGAAKVVGSGAAIDGMKVQMQFILDNIYEYTRLVKDGKDARLYIFKVQENAMRIRAPMNQGINLWERMQKKFDLKFKLELCKKLGLMPGDLKLGFSESDEA